MNKAFNAFAKIILVLIVITIFAMPVDAKMIEVDYSSITVQLPQRGVCAHRGTSATHPENTVAAFNEAIRLGVQMIEFDVLVSKDGHPVVIHDLTLDRTTNATGKVSDFTRKVLRELDAGAWKSERFKGQRVHTLTRILSVMPDNIWLNINLNPAAGQAYVIDVARELVKQRRLHQASAVMTLKCLRRPDRPFLAL